MLLMNKKICRYNIQFLSAQMIRLGCNVINRPGIVLQLTVVFSNRIRVMVDASNVTYLVMEGSSNWTGDSVGWPVTLLPGPFCHLAAGCRASPNIQGDH